MDEERGMIKQSKEHVAKRVAARLATLAAKPKPVSEGWLREKYHGENLDCVQIGKILGRDPKTIWSWMKHYGIETRSRGHNTDHLAKDGSQFLGRKHREETKELIRKARLRDGRVPYLLKDGTHAMKGRTGEDHPSWRGGVTPERQALYGTTEWKSAVKAVWSRADACCERCGKDHRNIDRRRDRFHIHHILPFWTRCHRANPYNLALLCEPCHRFVHSPRNLDREFLPIFATFPVNGKLRRINYSPKKKMALPDWLKGSRTEARNA
jgi:hypothetical protein